jgi:hypothetical protein
MKTCLKLISFELYLNLSKVFSFKDSLELKEQFIKQSKVHRILWFTKKRKVLVVV